MTAPVPGWPGYTVSADGRVYGPSGHLLRQRLKGSRSPYPSVALRLAATDHPTWVAVHLLVARAYLGPADGRDVEHRDGNRLNPRLENLEYRTHAENVALVGRPGSLSLEARRKVARLARRVVAGMARESSARALATRLAAEVAL